MAKRGPKQKPDHLHVVDGTRRKDRHGDPDENPEPPTNTEGLDPPKKLSKRKQELWDQYIRWTPWLTQFDVPTAHMWVELRAEFERSPAKFVAARIGQLRALTSELGLNHLKAATSNPSTGKPNDELFD
jgi:hypothetical protein